MAKEDYERCKAAMEALENAYRTVFAVAHEGMTAEDIDTILRENLAPCGVEVLDNPTTPFVVEEGGNEPKLRIDRAPLQKNKFWAMDNTVRGNGYCADLGRFGFIGTLAAELARDYRSVVKREQALAALVRPRVSMKEIFDACPHDMPFGIHRIATEGNMVPMCGNANEVVSARMEESVQQGAVFEVGHVVCVEVWAGLKGGIEDMYHVGPEGLARMTHITPDVQVMEG